jgi:hypothetical protein
LSQQHLAIFVDNNIQILIIHPTETSKIWWWHNNCKKVFYTPGMFDKKIKNRYADVPWLTTTDPVQRARVQMSHYNQEHWYNELLQSFWTMPMPMSHLRTGTTTHSDGTFNTQ